MNNGFRVDDNVNLSGFSTKEPVRLDNLKALIHQGGRVDGDSPSHSPDRMLQGLLGSNRFELLQRSFKERSAGSSQDNSLDFFRLAGAKALVDSAVLAVNG